MSDLQRYLCLNEGISTSLMTEQRFTGYCCESNMPLHYGRPLEVTLTVTIFFTELVKINKFQVKKYHKKWKNLQVQFSFYFAHRKFLKIYIFET